MIGFLQLQSFFNMLYPFSLPSPPYPCPLFLLPFPLPHPQPESMFSGKSYDCLSALETFVMWYYYVGTEFSECELMLSGWPCYKGILQQMESKVKPTDRTSLRMAQLKWLPSWLWFLLFSSVELCCCCTISMITWCMLLLCFFAWRPVMDCTSVSIPSSCGFLLVCVNFNINIQSCKLFDNSCLLLISSIQHWMSCFLAPQLSNHWYILDGMWLLYKLVFSLVAQIMNSFKIIEKTRLLCTKGKIEPQHIHTPTSFNCQ